MKTVMTIGDLRKAIEGLDDALPIWIRAEAWNGDEVDTLHASAESARFAKGAVKDGSLADFFTGPPVDHLTIFANGVPEGTCRNCGGIDGKHEGRWCDGDDDSDEDADPDMERALDDIQSEER